MWWDERFTSFDGHVASLESCAADPGLTALTAEIALDSLYIRYPDRVVAGVGAMVLCWRHEQFDLVGT